MGFGGCVLIGEALNLKFGVPDDVLALRGEVIQLYRFLGRRIMPGPAREL